MDKPLALADGVWPTMITPFTSDGQQIHWDGIDALIDWYIASGCAGLFTLCLSSEMYELSGEERFQLVRHVHNKCAGRVPVVAGGTFRDCGSLEKQAQFMLKISAHCEAVVIVVNQLATQDEDDAVWMQRVQQLMDLTGDLALGIYESPLPYHRTLTPSMVEWLASSGRVRFYKDTSLHLTAMAGKLTAARRVDPHFRFFTAKAVFSLKCLRSNGSGYSGIAANFFPWLFVWLCENHAKRPQDAERVQRFLTLADFTLRFKYPVSAKAYHRLMYGLEITPAVRIQTPTLDSILTETEIAKLKYMHEAMLKMTSSLGVQHHCSSDFYREA
eukprot:scpid89749/ scgid1157/ Dihydrodipicolinate synthase